MTKTQIRNKIKNGFKYVVLGELADFVVTIDGINIGIHNHVDKIGISIGKNHEIKYEGEVNRDEAELDSAVEIILTFVKQLNEDENSMDDELNSVLSSNEVDGE